MSEIDWENAPEGATHCNAVNQLFYKMASGCTWHYWFEKSGAWIKSSESVYFDKGQLIPRPTSTAIPVDQPKTLTQAVFDKLPEEYRWAVVDSVGKAHAWSVSPSVQLKNEWGYVYQHPERAPSNPLLIGSGYNTTNWQNSKIEREEEVRVAEKGGRCATCTTNICTVIDDCYAERAAKESRRIEREEPVPQTNLTTKDVFQKLAEKLVGGWAECREKREQDAVNHPSHYKGGGIECIDAMQAMLTREEFVGYLRGNIFKYQWRYKHKNGAEDLRKADWYAQRLIGLESGDEN